MRHRSDVRAGSRHAPHAADRTQVGQYVEVRGQARTEVHEVALAPEQVWKRQIEVYRELELPVATLQSAEMRIGNPDFTIRRSIGGLAASRVFECGSGRAGMLVAEIDPVRISLHSRRVAAEGRGTRVESLPTGNAQDAGGGAALTRCAATAPARWSAESRSGWAQAARGGRNPIAERIPMDRIWVWGVTVHPREGPPRLLEEHWISVEGERVRVWRAPDAKAPVAEAPLSYATIHWRQPPEPAGRDG